MGDPPVPCWLVLGGRGGDRGASLLSHGGWSPPLPQRAARGKHSPSGAGGASPEPPIRGHPMKHPPPPPLQASLFLLQKPFPPKALRGAVGRLCPRSRRAPRSWQPRGAGGAGGGRRGPVPLRGVAVTQRALFFAGERDGHPEGEIQGEGPPGRRGLPQTAPQQLSGRSGELTKSSAMGEYGVRVADTQRAVTGGSGDPVPRQSSLKLSSGTGRVPVWPCQPWELPGEDASARRGRHFLSQSGFLSPCAHALPVGTDAIPI